MIRVTFVAAFLTVIATVAIDTPRAAESVDLELILAVDVSGSIDEEEAQLQRQGYADALSDPLVIAAVKSGMLGRMALTYVEWAALGHYRAVVDWSLIDGRESAEEFVRRLITMPVVTARRTSISSAIEFSLPMFDANEFDGMRRVIDISGDGANNYGRFVNEARDEAVAAGITINGLPIVNDRPSRFGWRSIPNLDLYYEHCVVGGPGAFIVVAESFQAFATAVRRKLILEIADASLGGRSSARFQEDSATAGSGASDLHLIAGREIPACDVGEQRWREFIGDRF